MQVCQKISQKMIKFLTVHNIIKTINDIELHEIDVINSFSSEFLYPTSRGEFQ